MFHRIPLDSALPAAEMMRIRQPVFIEDWRTVPPFANHPRIAPLWRSMGIVGVAGYPLEVRGELLGSMGYLAQRTVTPEEFELLGIFADQAALAIKSAFLFRELARHKDRLQIENSDVITFHNYDHPTELEKRINWLKRYNRPMICTEYMARGNGSFFFGGLMIGKVHNVGMINWGLVQGKTQTNLPWDSWQHPYVDREPSIWFHEVFRNDGKPYIPEEVEFIKRMTGKVK